MKIFVLSVLIFFSIVVERVFSFAILGVKPDFLLILVVFVSLLKGSVPGLKVGFAVGLVEDLVSGKYFGIHILTKMFTGFIVGLLEPKIFKENYLVPVVALCLGTLVQGILFVILGNIIGLSLPWGNSFWYLILPLTGYHAVLAPFLYVPFYKGYTSKWLNRDR